MRRKEKIIIKLLLEQFGNQGVGTNTNTCTGTGIGSCGKSVIFPHPVGFHSSTQNIY